jgi:omega-6 fatty acid desaturase (delta-12 desaturase)
MRAFLTFVQAYVQTILSVLLLWHTPDDQWLLLLPAWFLAGTCATGLFVVGHECGHTSYSRSEVVNELVGTAALAPLLWPYHSWKRTHNNHHANTNNLDRDHLWRPMDPETVQWMDTWFAPVRAVAKRVVYYFYLGPLFFESSILHHLMHFNPFFFKPRDRPAVLRSILATVLPCGFMFASLHAAGGAWLVLKMWGLPYLVFNFWLSTYTYFHHKAADIKWHHSDDWNKAEAQLFGTVHVDYHPVIEFLHFDINWYVRLRGSI